MDYRYLLIAILLVLSIIFVFGCTSDDDDSKTDFSTPIENDDDVADDDNNDVTDDDDNDDNDDNDDDNDDDDTQPPAPETPSGLTATRINTATVELAWQDNSDDEEGFYIQRSTNQIHWVRVDETEADRSSASDQTAVFDTQYFYRLVAFRGDLESLPSNTASPATVGWIGLEAPVASPGTSGIGYVVTADIDQDGYLDIATAHPNSTDMFSTFLSRGNGQFSLFETFTYDGTLWPRPSALLATDFSGDGWPDVATVSNVVNRLSIYENNGDGTFSDGQRYITEQYPLHAASADMDQDGDLDILVVNAWSDSLQMFANDGSGSFTSGPVYSTSELPYCVVIEDFNADGYPDAAVLARNGEDVSVYCNLGDGTLGSPASYPVADIYYNIAAADMDLDGDSDIVAAGAETRILLNDGSGNFSSDLVYSIASQKIFTGDFNNDGTFDLVTLFGKSVSVYHNQGDLSFNLAYENFFQNCSNVSIADLDNDGFLDLATGSGSPSLIALLNKGDGTFPHYRSFDLADPNLVHTLDANNDGFPDLAVTRSSGVTVMTNDGAGGFSLLPLHYFGLRQKDINSTDINADGFSDIVFAADEDGYPPQIHTFLNRGDGTYPEPDFYSAPPYYSANPLVGDWNNDGYMDVADVSCCDPGYFNVFWNNGDGTFTGGEALRLNSGPKDVAKADLNQDGFLDAAIAQHYCFWPPEYCDDSIQIVLNQGDQIFAVGQTLIPDSGLHAVALGDLNNDQIPDMAASSFEMPTIYLYFNNGDGSFPEPVLLNFSYTARKIEIADVTGDGHNDIVAVIGASDELIYFPNQGDGTFGSKVSFSIPCDIVDLDIGLLNSDTALDIALSCDDESQVWILQNNGTGDFSAQNSIEACESENLKILDINSDQNQDIVAVCSEKTFAYLQNNGNMTFEPPLFYGIAETINSIDGADVDGDGYAEVITGHFGEIGVVRNRGDGTLSASLVTTLSASNLYAFDIADMNQDGISDLVVTTGLDSILLILIGDDSGRFLPWLEYDFSEYLGQVKIADLNDDGDPDGIVSLTNSYSLAVMRNNGAGNFTFETSVSSWETIRDFQLADMDGDGYLEIVAAIDAHLDSVLEIYQNDGLGNFSLLHVQPTGFCPFQLSTSDMDEDGDMDVVAVSLDGATASVYLNHGNGTLAPGIDYASGPYSRGLSIGDYDQDNDIDVAIASFDADRVSIIDNLLY